jgi:DNA-binding LytR/AlgR family response regulator
MGKSHLNINSNSGYLLFKTHRGLINISVSAILYCKSEGNYTIIVDKKDFTNTICKTLKSIEKVLNKQGFVRCHYKWLVNITNIESFCSKQKTIRVSSLDIPISRSKFDQICLKLLSNGISDKSG